MPVAETLINAAAGHKMLSFMDDNAGYNQIFMAPEDVNKTAKALILLRYLFVLGLCSSTDRLVMMDAVWEFCWCRLEGRLILFPSE